MCLVGCFDIMHSGHYNAIRQAKALCDILVVGVHSDAEILKHKGPPVMNEKERMANVEACKWVDEVVFDTPYDPSLQLLDKLNCDFCVHGDDMSTTADGKDAYEEVKSAGRMKIVKRTEGISTTDLVGRLLLMTKQHHINSPTHSPAATFAKTASSLPELALDTASSPTSEQKTVPEKQHAPAKLDDKHYARGISNFLPTTWRISQFSNHRTPVPNSKIIYIDGAFDLFHVGHIQTLKKVKSLGDFLYVGIHDDLVVNAHKGKNYPIMNLHERVMNVLSCKYVDEVIIGAPWIITKDLLTTLNISVVVSGSSTKMDSDRVSSEDPYKLVKELGKYSEIDSESALTTDQVVNRIIDNRLKYENRNANRSKKEVNYLTGQKQYVAEV
jgi:ethanolamine-phosphate cytidylyltransferase